MATRDKDGDGVREVAAETAAGSSVGEVNKKANNLADGFGEEISDATNENSNNEEDSDDDEEEDTNAANNNDNLVNKNEPNTNYNDNNGAETRPTSSDNNADEGASAAPNNSDNDDDSDDDEEEDTSTANNNLFIGGNNSRHAGGGAKGIAYQMGNNILHACSCLASSVREYYRMPPMEQLEVWDDLTGYQGQKRVFVQGKELPGFREEYEPRSMVEEAVKQLPLELDRMPSSHKHDALDRAREIAPDYVHGRAFLLKFLRAEKFDVFSAASRMCRHFEAKAELFGSDALGREIVLEDLNEDDMAAFESGYIQVLQAIDQGRRPVIFYFKAVSSECYKERENILRAFWYMANRLSDEEEVQKLGVSNVVYNNGGFPRQGMDYEKSRPLAFLFRSVPVRYNNFFVCLDDNPWLTVVETFAVTITRFLRVRLRMIRGTHEQVLEKLKAVGVPVEALPVNDGSELLLEAHMQWIQKQRDREEKLREQEEVGDLVEGTTAAPIQVNDLYQMDTLLALSDLTASLYGRGPADNGLPADSFHAVG